MPLLIPQQHKLLLKPPAPFPIPPLSRSLATTTSTTEISKSVSLRCPVFALPPFLVAARAPPDTCFGIGMQAEVAEDGGAEGAFEDAAEVERGFRGFLNFIPSIHPVPCHFFPEPLPRPSKPQTKAAHVIFYSENHFFGPIEVF